MIVEENKPHKRTLFFLLIEKTSDRVNDLWI